ncbi:MAG TPA: GNAT family N-acetyltransferase [Acidimicrobiales bacterium]|nr:GNAT family N-acetyltransferase [Acidimicrobiales bacterium]
MALRPATLDDVDEIAALIRELAEYEKAPEAVEFDVETLAEHLFGDDPAAHVVLAVDDDTDAVAGFALYFRTFSTWLGRPGIWLEDLFVRPSHRGRGHGAALLMHLRSLTDDRIEWAVLDWNQPAIDFYESLGARPVAGWTRYRWT